MSNFLLICLVSSVWLEFAVSFKILRNKRSSDEIDRRCFEPPESGPCRAAFENYFYNASTDECETFIYGGCQGNENNFWTKHVCEGVCKEYIEGYYDDDDYDIWQALDPITEGKDDCDHPPDEGVCNTVVPQYFFNGDTCELFAYTGCGGNPNRFNTEKECMERCGLKHKNEISFKILRNKRSIDEIPRRCYEPPESGPCRAAFENYFYNASTDECETFIYGGCQGNDNNFWTKHVCEGVCKEYIEGYYDDDDYDIWQALDPITEGNDDCDYPLDEGVCNTVVPQYFFNGDTCELFAYGGCGGNPNRFNTEKECMEKCGLKHEDESDNEI